MASILLSFYRAGRSEGTWEAEIRQQPTAAFNQGYSCDEVASFWTPRALVSIELLLLHIVMDTLQESKTTLFYRFVNGPDENSAWLLNGKSVRYSVKLNVGLCRLSWNCARACPSRA